MPKEDEEKDTAIDVDVIEETIDNLSGLLDTLVPTLQKVSPDLAARAQRGAIIGRKIAPLIKKVKAAAKTVSDATVTKSRPITPR